MKCAFLFLIFVPLFVRGADLHPFQDGPCPASPPTSIVIPPIDKDTDSTTEQMRKVLTVWYDIASNCAQEKQVYNEKKCFKHHFTLIGGSLYQNTTHEDMEGGLHKKERQWVAVEGQPGRYVTYVQEADGEWKADGWVYGVIGVEEEYTILGYGCHEVGDQHRDLYYIRSTSRTPSEEKVNKLKQMAHDNGDDREFITPNYENCSD